MLMWYLKAMWSYSSSVHCRVFQFLNLFDALSADAKWLKSLPFHFVFVQAVCTEAGMFALRERRVHVTQEDFEMAVAKVMKKDTETNMSLRKLWKWGSCQRCPTTFTASPKLAPSYPELFPPCHSSGMVTACSRPSPWAFSLTLCRACICLKFSDNRCSMLLQS